MQLPSIGLVTICVRPTGGLDIGRAPKPLPTLYHPADEVASCQSATIIARHSALLVQLRVVGAHEQTISKA